jgi:hypothetical protein
MTEYDNMKRVYWAMHAADVHSRALKATELHFNRAAREGGAIAHELLMLSRLARKKYKALWIERYHVEKRRIVQRELDKENGNPLHYGNRGK